MVKSCPRIPQLQLLYPRSKIMKKKSMTPQRRSLSSSISLSSPPQPSPKLLLKRTYTDDPDSLFSDSKKIKKTITEDVSPTTEISISPTLEGYLPPPLPPPPSPEFLRRTVSSSTTSLSTSTNSNVTTSKEMKAVSVTGEWMMVKCSCECGKDYTILINKTDNKCHKLV
ncbi:uncharacterized protein LOC141645880 isoform X1 [Silene latifolia]|uniref:uncharacterized protein LOC141645880 isoform X1 n=1 Tax=Silene latifolia TaxID=37657 RepID=UPI003D774083